MLLSKLVQSLTRLRSKITSTCRIELFRPEKSIRIKRVKLQFIKLSHGLIRMGGGCSGSGTPSPDKSQKYRVILQYWSGSPEKNTKHPSQHSMLGHHRPASEANLIAFRWRVDGGPFIAVFGSSMPSSTKTEKKLYQIWTPVSDKAGYKLY